MASERICLCSRILLAVVVLGSMACSEVVGPSDSGNIDSSVRDASALDSSTSEPSSLDARIRADARSEAGDSGLASQDAAEGGAQSRCDDGASLLCDGFESATIRNPPWYETADRGSLSVTDQNAYRGSYSMLASISESGATAFIGSNGYGPIGEGTLHARVYVRIPGTEPLSGLSLIGISQDGAPYEGVGVVATGGGFGLDVSTATQDLFLSATSPHDAIARNQWLCLRLAIEIGQQGAVRLWVDDDLVVEATGINTIPAQPYESATLGIVYSNPIQTPLGVLFDQLVLDSSPIACD